MTDGFAEAMLVADRRAVLESLLEPRTRPELVAELDSSRSTVDRAVDALQTARLVERTGSTYEATFAGREALAALDQYLERFETLQTAQPVLEAVGDEVVVDPAILDGATIVAATPEAPMRPVDRGIARIEGATRFRGTGPSVIPAYIDLIDDLLADSATVELVITEGVLAALTEDYADGLATLRRADGVTVLVTDEPMTTAIWTAERPTETVSGLVTYGETGVRGAILNTTDAIHEWVAAEYERYRASASPLD